MLEGLLRQAAARRRKTWRLQLAGAAASVTLLAGAVCGTWSAVIGAVDSEATPPGPTMPAPSRTFSGHDPATGVTAQSRRARSRSPVAQRAVSSVLLGKVNECAPASVLTWPARSGAKGANRSNRSTDAGRGTE